MAASNIETELADAFYNAIHGFAGDIGLAVSYPNPRKEFDPSADFGADKRHFLKPSILPVDPENVGVCGDEAQYIWIGQVLVYAIDGIGDMVAIQHAQALRARFPRFHEFLSGSNTFRVERTASIKPPVPADGWYFIPVQFRIQAIV